MTDATIRILGLTCVVAECITCGVPFTVPLTVYEEHRKRGGYHHCSNGHSQGWSKDRSKEEKDRQELARLRQQQVQWDWERRELLTQADHERRRAAASRGQVTKLKKRAAAGVCPCCNRTFQDLARHMSGQHPAFITEQHEADHVH